MIRILQMVKLGCKILFIKWIRGTESTSLPIGRVTQFTARTSSSHPRRCCRHFVLHQMWKNRAHLLSSPALLPARGTGQARLDRQAGRQGRRNGRRSAGRPAGPASNWEPPGVGRRFTPPGRHRARAEGEALHSWAGGAEARLGRSLHWAAYWTSGGRGSEAKGEAAALAGKAAAGRDPHSPFARFRAFSGRWK